jgi:hypothetical protein
LGKTRHVLFDMRVSAIVVLALLAFVDVSRGDDPREDFWLRETNREAAAADAKRYTFFLRIVIGGDWGPETAAYEATYSGDASDLDLGRGADVVGLVVRRDANSESQVQISKYELSHLIRDCINRELFEIGSKSRTIVAPDVIKMDGCSFWIYIKFADAQNAFGRTDDSIPVWQSYVQVRNLVRSGTQREKQKTAQPGATDNPGDAQ